MNKSKILSIAICCLVSALWLEAQGMNYIEQHSQARMPTLTKIPNQLLYSTVRIKTDVAIGTGFLFKFEPPEKK